MKRLVLLLAAVAMVAVSAGAVGASNTLSNSTHWADEPYYDTGQRYVWFIDQSGRAEWETYTQEWVAAMNDMRASNHALPYFFWYRASDITWPSGINACQRGSQILSICPNTWENPGQPGSYNFLQYDVGAAHFTMTGASIRIHTNTSGSALRNLIWHEGGHALGLGHQPGGPMGCTCTVGYTSHDFGVLNQLYGHAD